MTMSSKVYKSDPSASSLPWEMEHANADVTPVYEPLWLMLQSFLGSVSVHTVLDFGCGDGAYACLMGKEGFRVTGIDISEAAIRKAINRNCPNGAFIRHNGIPDDISDRSFDVMVLLNSLHCMDRVHRSELYDQASRVLKPHGYIFASVLSLEDESYPRQEWEDIGKGTFIDTTGKLFHFFSETELVHELSWLNILEIKTLQNIHPACGRKSALFVVAAQYPGSERRRDDRM